MKTCLFVLIFCTWVQSEAQINAEILVPMRGIPYSINQFLNMVLEQAEDQPNYFRKKLEYSSTNLYLNPDSTFVFYYVSEDYYQLTLGRYLRSDDFFLLNWDSLKTIQAAANPAFYKTYFRFKTPHAHKIANVALRLEGKELLPFHSYLNKDRLELLLKSEDLFRSNPQIENFKSIYYNHTGTRILVNYGKNQQISLSPDSIWGFVVTQNRRTKVYRTMSKGFNWYGVPGIQIVQLDNFILYTVGEERMYSYFSRDFNSKVYPLRFKELEEVFKDIPDFVKTVRSEFGEKKPLYMLNRSINGYRVAEIYKECLTKEQVK